MVWWILGMTYWTYQDHTQEGARKIISLINQFSDYCILNDRPLTYTSTYLNDPEPLCPLHLLYRRRIVSLLYPLVSEDPKDPDYLPTPIRGMLTH